MVATRVKSLLGEYCNSNDVGEAVECVDELKIPKQLYLVVKHCMIGGTDVKPELRTKFTQLMSLLIGHEKCALNAADMERGCKESLLQLEELAEELPVAAQRMAHMVTTWIIAGHLTLKSALDIDALAELKESGSQATKFVGELLVALKEAKDAAFVKALWSESSLTAEKFLANTSALPAFIEKYKLEALEVK
jgi:hypothetical protein